MIVSIFACLSDTVTFASLFSINADAVMGSLACKTMVILSPDFALVVFVLLLCIVMFTNVGEIVSTILSYAVTTNLFMFPALSSTFTMATGLPLMSSSRIMA